MRLGIAAIVKNEARYLVEWIAFHQAIGFDAFFIAENDSTDETAALLGRLEAAGIVTWFRVPASDESPQLSAYRELLARHGQQCDWLAFIDADEFIVPTGALALRDFIERTGADDVGAIALNWATFGSSGLEAYDPRLVLERFTHRGRQEEAINRQYKSLLRTAAVDEIMTPHYAMLKPPYRSVQSDGTAITYGIGPNEADHVCWAHFRVNHYVVKSRSEWRDKRARGRATAAGKISHKHFRKKDLNDVADPIDPLLIAATKQRIAELAALIA